MKLRTKNGSRVRVESSDDGETIDLVVGGQVIAYLDVPLDKWFLIGYVDKDVGMVRRYRKSSSAVLFEGD